MAFCTILRNLFIIGFILALSTTRSGRFSSYGLFEPVDILASDALRLGKEDTRLFIGLDCPRKRV